jgi:hypothetical protein
MKTSSRRQLHLAEPLSASSHRQTCRVVAQKCKGAAVSRAEKKGVPLPIPLQENARKSITKQMAQVSTCGGQIGIDVRHRRLPKTGKRSPSRLTPKSDCSWKQRPYANCSLISPLKLIRSAWFNIPSFRLGCQCIRYCHVLYFACF